MLRFAKKQRQLRWTVPQVKVTFVTWLPVFPQQIHLKGGMLIRESTVISHDYCAAPAPVKILREIQFPGNPGGIGKAVFAP